MFTNLYLLKCTESSQLVEKTIESMDLSERIDAVEFAMSFFHNQSIDADYDLIIANEYEIEKYEKLILETGVKVELTNYSLDAINGTLPEVFSYDMKVIAEKFVENFATRDMILDKINKYGIESLNKIDYLVLKTSL
jgi:hypothetical protein